MAETPSERPIPAPRELPIMLRADLVDDGFNDKAIKRMLEAGVLAKVRWGAYVNGRAYRSYDPLGLHILRARAALRQARTEMTLSHVSALVLHGSPAWGLDLETVHLTRHDQQAGRREAGLAQHRGVMLPDDATEVDGLPVMAVERAILELTTMAPVVVGLAHANHHLRAGAITGASLRARYDLMERWPSTLSTDLVIRLARPQIASVLESRFFYFCHRNSIPEPKLQHEVRDEDGELVAALDFSWPDRRKYVEVDGATKYLHLLRPGETAAQRVVADKRRDDLVKRLTGFDGIRVMWPDLNDEARLAAQVRAFLGLRPLT